VSATFVADDRVGDKGAGSPVNDRNHQIIWLAELLHEPRREIDAHNSARSLFTFPQGECANEILPVLRSGSSWDQTPCSSFLHAKAALDNQQPTPAFTTPSPSLDKPDTADSAHLLGARICGRPGNTAVADGFLAPIPRSARLAKASGQVKKSSENSENRENPHQTKSA